MQSSNHSRYEIWQPMLLALVLAGGMLLGTRLDDEVPNLTKSNFKAKEDPWNELKTVIGFIESRYGDSLDVGQISQEAINLLVTKLDPHSYYLSGMEYMHFKERMMGSYIGLGIDYDLIKDTMRLLKVVPNSPAERSGLCQGDRILAIDDQPVSGVGMTQKEAYEVWKKAAKTVHLKIKTSATSDRIIEVQKGPVTLVSVPVGVMIDDRIAYIKISRFASDTYREFMDQVEKLEKEGMKDLIIDVRENPGGSLDQVIKILNQLVSDGDQILLYTEGLNTKKVEYKSTGKPFFTVDKIAVIINENSVSASEVLAGSLQDLGRATIVGRRSFGKGLVQEMYDLTSESAINLTVARYYLPSGRSIQKSYQDRKVYEGDIKDRIENGELFHRDSMMVHNVLPGIDETVSSWPSGEGIFPDVFVPADSFFFSSHWMSYEHQLYSDAFDYYMAHQDQLKEMIESKKGITSLEPEILNRSIFSFDTDMDNSTKEKILQGYYHLLKWHHYGEGPYFENMISEDEEIKAAIKTFQQSVN